MKTNITLLLFFFVNSFSYSQQSKIDSLNRLLAIASSDTQRINLNVELTKVLSKSNLDSAIRIGNQTVQHAKAIGYFKGEQTARINLANAYCFKGEYTAAKQNLDVCAALLSQKKDSIVLAKMYNGYGTMNAMQSKYDSGLLYYQKAISIAEVKPDKALLGTVYEHIAIAYQQQANYPKALVYYQKAITLAEAQNDEEGLAYLYLNMALTLNNTKDTTRAERYLLMSIIAAKKLDLKIVEAYAYSNLASLYGDQQKWNADYDYSIKAVILAKAIGDQGIEASSLSRAAMALVEQDQLEEAEKLSRQALQVADSSSQPLNIYQAYYGLGSILKRKKEYVQAIPYMEKALHALSDADLYDAQIGDSYFDLSECYEQTGDYKKALPAYKTATKIFDSVASKENVRKATELSLNYEFQKKQQLAKLEQDKKDAIAQRIRTQQYFIITALGLVVLAVVIIVFIQYRSNKHKAQANVLLQQQKEKVESTLSELKATQAQLIQSEKMASLGELTAGIAHEIQNPLNFVNNFSETNTELIQELRQELNGGHIQQANAIAADIEENEQKINHHGKRADAIVKNMLEHTHTSKGERRPVYINTLTEEYLRLAYHGFRAKDKAFNAIIEKHFDETIGKVNVVPQDVGRVLLNLFNNAFWAVNEKKKQAGDGYKPTITVSTKKENDKVEIMVADNGSGIPQHVLDKVFQPFFTTKPTGEGTGLGLSLSYDIVKAHGGELKAESIESEGATFRITLSQ